MARPTSGALAERGVIDVEPDELDQALAEALDRQKLLSWPRGDSALPAHETEILEAGGFDLSARKRGATDPLARGLARHVALVKTALTVGKAAAHLGVTEGRVRQRLGKHELYGVAFGREWRLPAFQFTDEGEVPGWAFVAPRLPPDIAAVELDSWLTTPNPDLTLGEDEVPVSPRDWLCAGRSVKVVAQLAADLA